MSYRRDSDIFSPYGSFEELPKVERHEVQRKLSENFDVYSSKTETGAITFISNCKDDARRYKAIDILRTYIPVKVFGRCGEGRVPAENRTFQNQYRFFLALENSDCVDYVTEKYWQTLTREQIPIVAWSNNMTGIVIPESYINIKDFPDIETAGKYIRMVNNNATLYNSYFKWKSKFRKTRSNAMCKLCRKLRNRNVTQKVYKDFKGWLKNDTCEQQTVSFVDECFNTDLFPFLLDIPAFKLVKKQNKDSWELCYDISLNRKYFAAYIFICTVKLKYFLLQ